jgi:hypothetical protein
LGKTDARKIVNLEIAHRNTMKAAADNFIYDLKGKINELGAQLAKMYVSIKHLRVQQRSLKVSLSELEKSVTDFYDGWLAYLNSRGNCETIKGQCEAVLTTFSTIHFRESRSYASSAEESSTIARD